MTENIDAADRHRKHFPVQPAATGRPSHVSLISRLAWILSIVLLGLTTACTSYGDDQDSGGQLLPEQAAYDVTFYALALDVEPESRRISGRLSAHVAVKDTLGHFVLHLDDRLEARKAVLRTGGRAVPMAIQRRREHQIWMELPATSIPGDSLVVEVTYDGEPRTAPNPPWNGGFTWDTTAAGHPWIATSCQTEGADLWWPVKDHPSDEPDSMALQVTVPKPLQVASNGRLRRVENGDKQRTFHWFVSTPINTYGVALNIAPYVTVETTYESVSGKEIPVTFWALREDSIQARKALPEFLSHVRFLEETLGPYPFRADKYGIAQTPFLGMEHQTIIAYGNTFGDTGTFGYDQGFDALHFHELAHEWYGNLVTNRDWKDFWIHEGFASYLEALFAEHLNGQAAYDAVIAHMRRQIRGREPIARHQPTTAKEIYSIDVYMKGALTLHTLRYLIGDDAFFQALRQMTYPKPALQAVTGGRQCRFVTSDTFIRLAEAAAGRELDWFFDVYLYQADLPRLAVERAADELTLRWKVPNGGPFPMPVEVQVGQERRRLPMEGGKTTVSIEAGQEVQVDPENRILFMNTR